jgi:hypothetical protein
MPRVAGREGTTVTPTFAKATAGRRSLARSPAAGKQA